MMILEITEDKYGKVMKAVSKIAEHAECLSEIFEDLSESEYGNRKHYDDDDMYNSRYSSRRGGRYSR